MKLRNMPSNNSSDSISYIAAMQFFTLTKSAAARLHQAKGEFGVGLKLLSGQHSLIHPAFLFNDKLLSL